MGRPQSFSDLAGSSSAPRVLHVVEGRSGFFLRDKNQSVLLSEDWARVASTIAVEGPQDPVSQYDTGKAFSLWL